MEYTVIKSKKRERTTEIKIIDNKVVIYAPLHLSVEEIDKIYNKYKDKLLDKIERNKSNNGYLHYLGNKYLIKVIKSKLLKGAFCELKDNEFTVYVPENKDVNIEVAIDKWKMEQARQIITERVKYYVEKYNFRFDFTKNTIKFKNQRTKWGSCSFNNNLNFNYNVIGKNIEVIDYLVVHELTHTLIKNHSKIFWDKVGDRIADYKKERKILKT